jgi:hypothetical protein
MKLNVLIIFGPIDETLSRKERGHWGDQGIGGWTILKWVLER